jgi:asparagine synthase (glutamine-hydrolysing)
VVEKQSPIEALLEIDWENYLPEYILRKADLCTMAHGLELRAPLLDHHWFQALLALPERQRFTQPPKLLLEPACAKIERCDLFHRKKRGFNPPLDIWLNIDLAARFEGLGQRLTQVTAGQIDSAAVDVFCDRYRRGRDPSAEQVLQLFILDESLSQLRAEAAR